MSDLNDRIEEPDSTEEFSLTDSELADAGGDVTGDEVAGAELTDDELADVGSEDVDPDEAESIDEVQDLEAEEINPVFGDDQEVIADNLNYDE